MLLTATRNLGHVVHPGDRGWDAARGTFNLLIDQRPEAIAFPADARETAAVVADARRARPSRGGPGDRAQPRSAGLARGDGDPQHLAPDRRLDRRGRRVGSGSGAATRWEAVVPRLSELGLAALHGSSPEVGIVGYSLGGGIGWLARKHGMQTNAVTAIELVTADGHLVRADATHEPELFWALRGGGGNFGIVTAIEFAVLPVRELYAGALFFPVERTADVLHAWTELLPALPEELTSWATIIHFPPMPELPEAIRGRSFVIVMAAFLGTEADGRELLRPLRALGPEMDTFATQPPVGAQRAGDGPARPAALPDRALAPRRPPAAAIEDVARIAGPGSALTLLQLRHMGGALARHEPGAGARATLPGEIAMLGLGVVPTADAEPVVRRELGALSAAVAPGRVGDYPNFVEEPADASGFFDAGTWERLRRVKALHDPEDVFKGNHHIPPAERP